MDSNMDTYDADSDPNIDTSDTITPTINHFFILVGLECIYRYLDYRLYAMSLAETVIEKVEGRIRESIPKTVKNIIEFAIKHGVSSSEIDVVKPTRARDPILCVKGRPVASWIKI